MIEQKRHSIIGNISQKLLQGYMSHPAIGYEMGFAAVTREDFKMGHLLVKLLIVSVNAL